MYGSTPQKQQLISNKVSKYDNSSEETNIYNNLSPLCQGAMCANIPPGMDKLKLGLDIGKLDLLPKEAETADMGYKRPVFDYTCEEGENR